MARRRLARYPGWPGLTTLLEVLWRGGKADAAAALLLQPPFQLQLDSWRKYIGPSFARAFHEARDADALAAFGKIQQAGIRPRELREMTLAISQDLRNAAALSMLFTLVEGGATDPVTVVRTAGLLRLLKGEAAARDWLQKRIRPDEVWPVAMALFEQEQDALLWAALPDPLPVNRADDVWLLRAGAVLRSPAERGARGATLAQHFADAQGSETYMIGRYLAGPGDEKSVPGTNRTRAAWAMGARAEAEGRRMDAFGWYEVAAAGGSWKEPEHRLAAGRLEALTAPAIIPSD
jgi:hypothetical protein